MAKKKAAAKKAEKKAEKVEEVEIDIFAEESEPEQPDSQEAESLAPEVVEDVVSENLNVSGSEVKEQRPSKEKKCVGHHPITKEKIYR